MVNGYTDCKLTSAGDAFMTGFRMITVTRTVCFGIRKERIKSSQLFLSFHNRLYVLCACCIHYTQIPA